MKSVISVVAAAVVAAIGLSSPAQAAVVNFGIAALGGKLTYTGATLDKSTAFDLDSSTLFVSSTTADNSGLAVFDIIKINPTLITYGMAPGGALNVVKSWTGTTGPELGDVFTETLTTVASINRGTANAITIGLTGTLTDSFGLFVGTPASMLLSANQVGGPGTAISVSLTNIARTSVVPEPSTWVMMGLGFAALGYAGLRHRSKTRGAAY
jgi:PEP-CTERM motif